MNTLPAALPRGAASSLAVTCSALRALSLALGAAANRLRPAASRLPWVGDWKHHIENKAFQAGIPVAFLLQARERLADPATVVFDARIPQEYAAGHVAGALNLPVGEVDARIGAFASRLTPATPLLLYCGNSDCADGLDLALKLREYGFTDLTLYPGGFAEWSQYGGAVRTGDEP